MKFNVKIKVPTEIDLAPGDRVVIQTPTGEVMGRIYKILITNDHPKGYVLVDNYGSYYSLTTYGKTWWKV